MASLGSWARERCNFILALFSREVELNCDHVIALPLVSVPWLLTFQLCSSSYLSFSFLPSGA